MCSLCCCEHLAFELQPYLSSKDSQTRACTPRPCRSAMPLSERQLRFIELIESIGGEVGSFCVDVPRQSSGSLTAGVVPASLRAGCTDGSMGARCNSSGEDHSGSSARRPGGSIEARCSDNGEDHIESGTRRPGCPDVSIETRCSDSGEDHIGSSARRPGCPGGSMGTRCSGSGEDHFGSSDGPDEVDNCRAPFDETSPDRARDMCDVNGAASTSVNNGDSNEVHNDFDSQDRRGYSSAYVRNAESMPRKKAKTE